MSLWDKGRATRKATPLVPGVPRDKHVRFTWMFAYMIASDRSAKILGVPDLLGGIYVAALESLVTYWRNWEEFERLVEEECGVREPRWFYWCRAYEALGHPSRHSFVDNFIRSSPEVEGIKREAEEVARTRSLRNGSPAVKCCDLLLCIARNQNLPTAKKLLGAGLDLVKLEVTCSP